MEQKPVLRILSAFAVISIQLLAVRGQCAIPYALRSSLMLNIDFNPSPFDFSKGYDSASVQPVESAGLKSSDVAKVIPANMAPTQDQGKIATQILDRSVSSYFDSDQIQKSSIGRTAKQVEKSMQTESSFGGATEDSIKHTVKFTVKATETRADLEYKGLTDAQLTYFVTQAKTNLEVREPMKALGTNLVYNNIISPNETRNMLSMRWIF